MDIHKLNYELNGGQNMKRLLLVIIAVAFLMASCSSVEQKKWDRSWEGPIISPSPKEKTY
jgi:hypothetical protein